MIALLLALALQTPAPTPPALPAPMAPALLPLTRGATRSGVAVVVVAAPQSPWAVAQLHVRLDAADLTPRARAATLPWSAVLADAARKPLGPTGVLETRLTPDSLVISCGVEAARLDDALKALDAVLRARTNKPPALIPAQPGTLQVVDDVVDAAAARALFPGSPIALPLDGSPLDAASAKALGELLTPDRLAVVVVGADSGEALLARVNRTITASLHKAQQPRTPQVAPGPGRVIHEKQGTSSSSSLTALIPARADAAPLLVLASLLGGRLVRSSVAAGVVVDVAAADRVALLAAEDDVVDQIRRVSNAPPPPEVTEVARERVLNARLQSLSDPGRVAHALGQAILDGRPTRVQDEVTSLQSLTPGQVSLAAAALQQAFVVVARTPGPEPAPPPKPQPTKPTTAKP